MISEDSFSNQWIDSINPNRGKADIIEKVVYALHLLECLISTRVDFVFKGGTSLMLMFDNINRFSTDIDILIEEVNMQLLIESFDRMVLNSKFIKYEENVRKDRGIKKKHFKFYYNSKITENENNVILDIVYGEIPYTDLIERVVYTPVVKFDEPLLKVKTPNIINILIDKLTAFAPHTIGIRYETEKYKEIIKQLYDISLLFEACDNFNNIKFLYDKFAVIEMGHRVLNKLTSIDCLQDSINTCKVILSNGNTNSEEFGWLSKGFTGFTNYVNEKLTKDKLYVYAANVYILCMMIKCGSLQDYKKYSSKAKTFNKKQSFINKTYNELKYYLSDKILELEEAIKIEQNFFIPAFITKTF